MEKELIINGVKYVKWEEPKVYQVFDLIKYNGYEWIVIKVEDNRLTLMMKNCLSEEKMKKIFNSKYLHGNLISYYVGSTKSHYGLKESDWNKTEIKRGLNNEFLKEFNKGDLIEMKTNFDLDKYSYDYIRIPTVIDIYELWEYKRIKPDYNCWTMSPAIYTVNDRSIWTINANSEDYDSYRNYNVFPDETVDGAAAVRPVITIKSDNPNIEKIGTV